MASTAAIATSVPPVLIASATAASPSPSHPNPSSSLEIESLLTRWSQALAQLSSSSVATHHPTHTHASSPSLSELVEVASLLHEAWQKPISGDKGETVAQLLPHSNVDTLARLIALILQTQVKVGPGSSIGSSNVSQVQHIRELLDELAGESGILGIDHPQMLEAVELVLEAHTDKNGVDGHGSRRGSRSQVHTRQRSDSNSSPTSSAASPRRSSSTAKEGRGHGRSLSSALGVIHLEDEGVASVRQRAFQFAFSYAARQESKRQPSQNDETAPFAATLRVLLFRGLTDMWSAIRKATAATLTTRGPNSGALLLRALGSEECATLVDALVKTALTPAAAKPDAEPAKPIHWQEQEGALLGLHALLRQYATDAFISHQPLPTFIRNLSPDTFYPLLRHPQLSVREATGKVIQTTVETMERESGAAAAAPSKPTPNVRQQVLDTLMHKLMLPAIATKDSNLENSDDSDRWLSDYESEGILRVCHAIGLGYDSVHVATLDHYLAHPASSVRQLAAEMLAKIALQQLHVHQSTTKPDHHDNTETSSRQSTFDLVSMLAGEQEWDWEAQEIEIAWSARTNPLTDAAQHNAAVYFSIPPPLALTAGCIAAAASRRASLSGNAGTSSMPGTPCAGAGTVSHSRTASNALRASMPPPHATHQHHHYRASWQWKEGAFMCLELYLQQLAPRLSSPVSSLNSNSLGLELPVLCASLTRILPELVRASLSWSWELRRMADQLRTTFCAVWLSLPDAGQRLIELMQRWLCGGEDVDESKRSGATTPNVTTPRGVQSISPMPASPQSSTASNTSLLDASSAVLALHYVLSYLHAYDPTFSSANHHRASHSRRTSIATDDIGIDRKFLSVADGTLPPVHPDTRDALMDGLPACLNWIERLVVGVTLHADHQATMRMATSSVAPSPADPSSLSSTLAVDENSTEATTVTPCITWEQFASLAIVTMVQAYACIAIWEAKEKEHSLSVGTETETRERKLSATSSARSLQRLQGPVLQHYQCVLDRLRVIRSMTCGEEMLPAPSVAAQLLPSTPSSVSSPSSSPLATPRNLPTLSSMQHPSTCLTPHQPISHKLQALTRARAKRLEQWLLGQMESTLAAFTSGVPAAAHFDLLQLLHDYLTRHPPTQSHIRVNLLRALAAGFSRTRILHSHPRSWSHQLSTLQDSSLRSLLQHLQERSIPHTERMVSIDALSAIIANTPMNTNKLYVMLEGMTTLVHDEYLTVELDNPPPSPSTFLSPTSAAIAQATEQWDDWDEESDEDDALANSAVDSSNTGAAAGARYQQAKQLVHEIAPLLRLLAGLNYTNVGDLTTPSNSQPPSDASAAAPTSSALDRSRQDELLQWMSKWSNEAGSSISPATSTSASTPPPSQTAFRTTYLSLPDEVRKKLAWIGRQQGKSQALHFQPSAATNAGASSTAVVA